MKFPYISLACGEPPQGGTANVQDQIQQIKKSISNVASIPLEIPEVFF